MARSIVVAVQLEHGGKGLAGEGDAAELTHLLLAFLLLFQQLFLTGDVAAVALGQNVFAHGLDGLAGNDLAADGSLHRDLEQVAGDVIPQLFADAAAFGVGVLPEHDHGQGVHGVAVQQEVQLDQIALAVLLELVVVAGIAAAPALDGIEEVVDDLTQRQRIVQIDPHIIEVLHVDEDAALLLAEIHQAADVLVGGVEVDVHERLLLLDDVGRVGVAGRVVDHLHGAVGQGQPVADAGGGGDDVEVKLPLQTLGDDLHVEQAEETAAETEAQSRTGLQLKGQGGVVQLQLFQRVLQIGVLGTVGGVDAAEHHGLDLTVAGQSLGGRVVGKGDGIAHPGILHRLDAGGQVADLTGRKLAAGGQVGGTHVADFHQRELRTGGHQADGVAGLDRALKDADVDDDALVAVINTVEDQGFQRGVRVAGGGGNVGDDPLQHLIDVQAGLGRDPGRIQTGQADHILHFLRHLVRVGTGQVDLVQDGHQLEVVLEGHIGVGEGLCLDALRGIDHKDRTLAGCQTAGDLVGKVHMTRGIDEVELVGLAVLGGVIHGHGAGFDGDAALPLDVHIVEDLILHDPLIDALGQLEDAVRQGGFAVVDVGDDTEIADVVSCHLFLR